MKDKNTKNPRDFVSRHKGLFIFSLILISCLVYVIATSYGNQNEINSPTGTHDNITLNSTGNEITCLDDTCNIGGNIDNTGYNATFDRVNEVLYVQAGNGSDIQAKIDLANNGSKIHLPSGNYTITSSIEIKNRSGLTIQGVGEGTHINQISNVTSFFIKESTGIVLMDMKISIHNISYGVEIRDVNDSIVENVNIEGVTTENVTKELMGIMMKDSKRCTLKGNQITGVMWDSGIRIDAGGNTNLNGMSDQHNIITENIIFGVGNNSAPGSISSGTCIENDNQGSDVERTSHNIFSNNQCFNNGGYGLRIIQCAFCLVEGNQVTNSGSQSGIWLSQTNYSLVSNNIIKDVIGEGIELTNNAFYNQVIGNYVYNSTSESILLNPGAHNNSILGNYLIENVLGLDDQGSDNFIGFNFNESISSIYVNQFRAETILPLTNNITIGDNSGISQYMDMFTSGSDDRGFRYFLQDGATLRGYIKWNNNEDLLIKGDVIQFDTQGGDSKMKVDNDVVTIGDGTTQSNITLTSPDGTESCCSVANDNSFGCTAGACG